MTAFQSVYCALTFLQPGKSRLAISLPERWSRSHSKQLHQRLQVHRLGQVMVEPRFGRAQPVAWLPVAGDGYQNGVSRSFRLP